MLYHSIYPSHPILDRLRFSRAHLKLMETCRKAWSFVHRHFPHRRVAWHLVQQGIRVENLRIGKWLSENPGSGYAEYYSSKQELKIKKGKIHQTLGSCIEGPEGKTTFRFVRKLGLQTHHTLVDYGCGSLRLGRHFIDFLEPGKYWGFDIIDTFYSNAADCFPPEYIETKAPHLHVIDWEELALARAASPDFVVCMAVLVHVPPEELDAFFKRILHLIGENGTILIHGDVANTSFRYSPESWAHSETILSETAASFGLTLDFENVQRAILRSLPKSLDHLVDDENIRTVWMSFRKRNESSLGNSD